VGATTTSAGASTDDPAVGPFAPATGTRSTAAPAARGDGGGGFHLSWAAHPPSLSSSSSSSYCSKRSHCWSLLSFARAARSCSRRYAARAADRARGVGGSGRAVCMVTRC
jgi:hypothetical protein